VLGLLGEGGMSRVFLGCSADGQVVAIKVIRTVFAGDPEFRARFSHEAAAVRKVGSRYTAAVVDADTAGLTPWLAVAYVAGPSLAETSAVVGGPLPLHSVCQLGLGLAEALQAIHAAGVVHRDLKPSNVLLAADGPRVIDFGIARAAEGSHLTRTGTMVGSPGFMAPEQITGDEVGPASDIFALGAVLAFAATGQGPFGEGRTEALVYRIVHGEPALDCLPEALRETVAGCLAKDPLRRPDPAEVITSLTGIPAAEPGIDAGWIPGPVGRLIELHESVATAAVTAWRESPAETVPEAVLETVPETASGTGSAESDAATTTPSLLSGGDTDPGYRSAGPVGGVRPVGSVRLVRRARWARGAAAIGVLLAVAVAFAVFHGHAKTGTTSAPPVTTSPAAADSAGSAAGTVEAYFVAVNDHDYARAWSLGGKAISAQKSQSYSQFVQGFTGTSFDSLTVASVDGNKVNVVVDCRRTNGETQVYQGYYIVEHGQIASASVQ
jgi:eukaryotic-like serine/threonine-protein kinase